MWSWLRIQGPLVTLVSRWSEEETAQHPHILLPKDLLPSLTHSAAGRAPQESCQASPGSWAGEKGFFCHCESSGSGPRQRCCLDWRARVPAPQNRGAQGFSQSLAPCSCLFLLHASVCRAVLTELSLSSNS